MWSSAAAATVSFWTAEESPEALAVIVAVPASVSLYLKLALFAPVGIVTLVIVAVSVLLRNRPPEELLVSVTVTFDDAFTGDPLLAWIWIVTMFDVTPAVSDWAVVVNDSFAAGGAAYAAVALGPTSTAIVSRTAADAVTLRELHLRTGGILLIGRFLDRVAHREAPNRPETSAVRAMTEWTVLGLSSDAQDRSCDRRVR
jgi:hypothetical protein